MRRIIECLLEEGIDESIIHRVLDLIEEEYDIIDEATDAKLVNKVKKAEARMRVAQFPTKDSDPDEFRKADKKLQDAYNKITKRAVQRTALVGRKAADKILKNAPDSFTSKPENMGKDLNKNNYISNIRSNNLNKKVTEVSPNTVEVAVRQGKENAMEPRPLTAFDRQDHREWEEKYGNNKNRLTRTVNGKRALKSGAYIEDQVR